MLAARVWLDSVDMLLAVICRQTQGLSLYEIRQMRWTIKPMILPCYRSHGLSLQTTSSSTTMQIVQQATQAQCLPRYKDRFIASLTTSSSTSPVFAISHSFLYTFNSLCQFTLSIDSFKMSAFTLSVAALAVASFASAKPIAPRVDTKTFTIDQSVAVPKVAGPVALANALTKYGAKLAADVAAAASSGTGTVAANPEQYDSEYLCKCCSTSCWHLGSNMPL